MLINSIIKSERTLTTNARRDTTAVGRATLPLPVMTTSVMSGIELRSPLRDVRFGFFRSGLRGGSSLPNRLEGDGVRRQFDVLSSCSRRALCDSFCCSWCSVRTCRCCGRICQLLILFAEPSSAGTDCLSLHVKCSVQSRFWNRWLVVSLLIIGPRRRRSDVVVTEFEESVDKLSVVTFSASAAACAVASDIRVARSVWLTDDAHIAVQMAVNIQK